MPDTQSIMKFLFLYTEYESSNWITDDQNSRKRIAKGQNDEANKSGCQMGNQLKVPQNL